jgi:hypothetical protein
MDNRLAISQARMGSVIGAIMGSLIGGLFGGLTLAYVGFIAGCVLGCVGGTLHCLESGWQLRSILLVFGGALFGLLIGPLLALPVGQLFGTGNLLVLVVTAAIGMAAGAMIGVALSMRLIRTPAAI